MFDINYYINFVEKNFIAFQKVKSSNVSSFLTLIIKIMKQESEKKEINPKYIKEIKRLKTVVEKELK